MKVNMNKDNKQAIRNNPLILVTLLVFLCFNMILSADEVKESTAKEKLTKLIFNNQIEWDFYGKIKVDLMYDSAQFVNYNDFVGAVANREVVEDSKNDSTTFNPRDTRFGIWAKYDEGNWQVKGRFEMDFYGSPSGNNFQPRMRLGYIDLINKNTNTSFLAGQDWIPISRLNPSTFDFGILAAGGNLWWRIPQVTLRQKLPYDSELLFSLTKHRRTSTASEDRMPWLLGRMSKNFKVLDLSGMLALGGGYRHESYPDESSDHDLKRWLLCGEGKVSYKNLILKGEYWYADGIGGHFLRYDLDINPKTAKTISGQGGWADITYKFTPKLSATIGCGFDNPDDNELLENRETVDLNNRQFTKNIVGYLNCWYQLLKPLRIGAEYMRVETEREMNTDLGNRFTLSMEYKF
jgi:hypothetical protein